MTGELEVSVLLPCLNEAETLAVCVDKAVRCLAELGVAGEVVVADNGSTDGSPEIAVRHGARVVHAPVQGYGAALLTGIQHARGRYVIMADADDSYDLAALGPFVAKLRGGHDLVMGNRFRGGIAPGAMPPLHRYLGNPVLSRLGRSLFGLRDVGDFHCGLRGFHRERILALGLCMPGMEFASELVVRAALAGYDITEVPTTLHPDGRSRRPHLRTWRDGWRHLRFLLTFAPGKTLIGPGAVLSVLGLIGTVLLTSGPVRVAGVSFDLAALIYAGLVLIVGVQLLLFGSCAKLYGQATSIIRDTGTPWLRLIMRFEVMLATGLLLILGGLIGTALALSFWGSRDFADLPPDKIIRFVMPSATLIAVGVLCIFSGLLSSLLTLRLAPTGTASLAVLHTRRPHVEA